MGQNVFYAVEENDCLSRQCCGPMRSFTIHVLDNYGQEIITVTRPLKCMSCCFPCCLQEVGEALWHTYFLFQGFTKSGPRTNWGYFSRNHFLVLPVWVCVYNISKSLLLSWRCSLPPVTQWGTLYNSGTRSPLNSSSQMNTLSLYWRSMGPSVDGAASQMLTLRWVYPNTEIH